jgi:HEAT repeat protein
MSAGGPKKGATTAEELMAELEADPEWVVRRDEQERARQEIAERNRGDSQPIRDELAELGFEIDSIADLYNRRFNYEAAIPILLDWFPRVKSPDVKESMARALTVRWARPEAAPMMLAELGRLRDSEEERSLRFAVANALVEVADDSVFEELVELVQDDRYPIADRGRLVVAFANMQEERERAIEVLRSLLDEDVAPHAIAALGELGATEACAQIEPFLEHEDSWVREEAKKALRKLHAAEHRGA